MKADVCAEAGRIRRCRLDFQSPKPETHYPLVRGGVRITSDAQELKQLRTAVALSEWKLAATQEALVPPEIAGDQNDDFRGENKGKKFLAAARALQVTAKIDLEIMHKSNGCGIQPRKTRGLHDQARRRRTQNRLGFIRQEYLRTANYVRPRRQKQGI